MKRLPKGSLKSNEKTLASIGLYDDSGHHNISLTFPNRISEEQKGLTPIQKNYFPAVINA